MTLDDVPLQPVDPAFRSVLRVRAAVAATVLLAAAATADIAWQRHGGVPGLIVLPALLWATWSVLLAPRRRWARLRFAFTGQELHVTRGWLTHAHTVVPVRRVQHIDLTQGPLERRYGLATLVLHTAGTEHARVFAPGLARGEAEAIRDAIRGAVAGQAA